MNHPTDGLNKGKSETVAGVDNGLSKNEADLMSAGAVSQPGSSHDNREMEEETPPPLPPRPSNPLSADKGLSNLFGSLSRLNKLSRPNLQAASTTAVSRTDIHTQPFPNGSQETYATSSDQASHTKSSAANHKVARLNSRSGSDAGSLRSSAPTFEAHGDVESLLGEAVGTGDESPAWKGSDGDGPDVEPFDQYNEDGIESINDFEHEFDDIGNGNEEGDGEEALLDLWKSKRKQFMILSSAGKPIYSRHGSDNLISGYIGIIQTIVSFYQGADDSLRAFTAGDVRFVVLIQGPLYLVVISRFRESDTQLRAQLEALYMQILSTLTLPTLTHLFSNRPSTDLRRPLQGTEPLLSALADSFTRGSPPTLLSALECLRLRKAHRHVIDNTLLKSRSENLLYGLIVAGGRLVSVVRPKRHSLHPGDLQLIFNMLFEAEGVKAGGGDGWIPLCLPGFNRNGYLYMFVSFLNSHPDSKNEHTEEARNLQPASLDIRNDDPTRQSIPKEQNGRGEEEVAVLLISANKESFYDLRKMRDNLVEQLEKNGSLRLIQNAIRRGRPTPTDIVPGTVIRHFLYKSRTNVQFVMPSYAPHFTSLLDRRRLLSIYHALHASVHNRTSRLKILHIASKTHTALAWMTPQFELYCVAGPQSNRNALAQGAGKIVQWARREEERIFILGGAVF